MHFRSYSARLGAGTALSAHSKKFNLTEQEIAAYLLEIRTTHFLSAGRLETQVVVADPDDDKIIACALEADADFIITGDPHLLNMKQYREIQIVTPRAFLEILDREPR